MAWGRVPGSFARVLVPALVLPSVATVVCKTKARDKGSGAGSQCREGLAGDVDPKRHERHVCQEPGQQPRQRQ